MLVTLNYEGYAKLSIEDLVLLSRDGAIFDNGANGCLHTAYDNVIFANSITFPYLNKSGHFPSPHKTWPRRFSRSPEKKPNAFKALDRSFYLAQGLL